MDYVPGQMAIKTHPRAGTATSTSAASPTPSASFVIQERRADQVREGKYEGISSSPRFVLRRYNTSGRMVHRIPRHLGE